MIGNYEKCSMESVVNVEVDDGAEDVFEHKLIEAAVVLHQLI